MVSLEIALKEMGSLDKNGVLNGVNKARPQCIIPGHFKAISTLCRNVHCTFLFLQSLWSTKVVPRRDYKTASLCSLKL